MHKSHDTLNVTVKKGWIITPTRDKYYMNEGTRYQKGGGLGMLNLHEYP
jgi:hypothetical protein